MQLLQRMEAALDALKSVQTRTMRAAAAAVGGSKPLRDRLGASSAEVLAWLSGTEVPPRAVFLRAVELVLDDMDRRDGGSSCRIP